MNISALYNSPKDSEVGKIKPGRTHDGIQFDEVWSTATAVLCGSSNFPSWPESKSDSEVPGVPTAFQLRGNTGYSVSLRMLYCTLEPLL